MPHGLPALRCAGRGDSFSTFRIIDPMSNLGEPSTPDGTPVPCRQLEDLQPDHLCKHEEAQLRPIIPRRSVVGDGAYRLLINLTILFDLSP